MPRVLSKVLVANRGEIAVRVIATCRAMGIATVAVYSDADRDALHVRLADEAVHVGPPPARESYLDVPRILAAARETGADAIHPGYGFLSENAGFARAVEAAGLAWIGPPPAAIEAMGSKIEARKTMEAAGVPVVPGVHDAGQDRAALVAAAHRIGFPVLVKAAAGGGGKGMKTVMAPDELEGALESAEREALAAFKDGSIYLEKLLVRPRHVEIQIFGDRHGQVIHLGERECSIQRRHQKVVEESPSPALTPALRAAMGHAAVLAGKAVGYVGAGTVELMLGEDGGYYFLEMNTRLQVEHPVTEAVYGVDLVRAQLLVAMGKSLDDIGLVAAAAAPRGHAIEVRLYAEDPGNGFLPATGTLQRWRLPPMPGVRLDTGYAEGDPVSVHYDPMLAKLIAWGDDREHARRRLFAALRAWEIHGVVTNLDFLADVIAHPAYAEGATHTGFIAERWPDGWSRPEVGDDHQILAAVARALGAGPTGAAAVGGEPAATPSPWTSLGPWRSA
ncbi:MAG: ATP-grasp domain-containing protein [Deltaproteobacteria bacterium]|nr:ATP-grasp domain-containing protein [Deltaproteobacteria bacterium]